MHPLHKTAIERSLALHRAVMERTATHPEILTRARARVAEWRKSGSVAAPYVDGWERILALPEAELRAAVLEDSEAAHDLRQVSPFAGALPPRERWRILRQWREQKHEAR